ncbi:MAG TPA: TetR/AcrR family transcriptional regulator [Acidimicrobiales bacterium]|nr:TetR/AcrR family transcriptional regulator [Acidimicrobiales bacterium]
MARTSGTRARLLDAGATLFRRQGYAGTGLKRIVDEGGAPRGSLYHFFPGGKEQLGAEAVARSGAGFRRVLESVLEGNDPAASVRAMFDLSAAALEASDYRDGCPVATVALEAASTSEPLRLACAAVFESWADALEERLVRARVDAGVARELAVFGLAAFEGAIVLSRTARTTRPLVVCGEAVSAVVAGVVAAGAPSAGAASAPEPSGRRASGHLASAQDR